MRYKILALMFILPLLITGWLLAMGGSHGPGNPDEPISVDGWSSTLKKLANLRERTGGSWVNQFDTFEYGGNTAAFNAFLVDFAKLPEGPHVLTLTQAAPSTQPAAPQPDWHMSIDMHWTKSPTTVGLVLHVGGQVQLSGVVLPEGLVIGVIGRPSQAIRDFLAKHPSALRPSTTRPIESEVN